MSEVQTCPKCGALIVPQLKRCRHCGKYLHGTAAEGCLVNLLPERLAHAPGTALMLLLILFWYGAMVVMAGASSFIGFSRHSLLELGADHGPSLLMGEYYRAVTSMFVHHNLLHLAFNVMALLFVGPAVEKLFDMKKMVILFLASGLGASLASFVYYVHILGGVSVVTVSAGASGAVCGLIGATIVGAKRFGPEASKLSRAMIQWVVYIVLFGALVPNINNAAHAGGFVIGAGLAAVVPLGRIATPGRQRLVSGLMIVLLLGVVGCFGLVLRNQYGYPAVLERDAMDRTLFGFTYSEGTEEEMSDQNAVWYDCVGRLLAMDTSEEAIHACELNRRVNGHDPRSYYWLAELMEMAGSGDADRMERLREVAKVLPVPFVGESSSGGR